MLIQFQRQPLRKVCANLHLMILTILCSNIILTSWCHHWKCSFSRKIPILISQVCLSQDYFEAMSLTIFYQNLLRTLLACVYYSRSQGHVCVIVALYKLPYYYYGQRSMADEWRFWELLQRGSCLWVIPWSCFKLLEREFKESWEDTFLEIEDMKKDPKGQL